MNMIPWGLLAISLAINVYLLVQLKNLHDKAEKFLVIGKIEAYTKMLSDLGKAVEQSEEQKNDIS